MPKFVVSSTVVTGLALALEQDIAALITKHAGSTIGDVAALIGQGIVAAVDTVVKPDSADAAGQAVAVTTNGKVTATDAAIETAADGAELIGQTFETELNPGVIHGAT